ncbi:iron uptake transporter permease EfeU [Chloroflexota bacterium]
MLSALLITFREGLEAALIIGIILAYLVSTGNRDRFKSVWIGTTLAIVVSLVAGTVIYFSAGQLEGRSEQIFEGVATLIAAGVLTWMIFWMRKQAINIKSHLHAQIQSSLGSGSTLGLLGLAFVAVVREGIETVLFLFAAVRVSESALLSAMGSILGLGIAVAIGYSIYKGTSRLNLSTFFKITGLLLILFAAGLLAHGIHELQEASIIPVVIEHVWDINRVLPEDLVIGRFLAAIFGYNANPSLLEVIAYSMFLVFTVVSYFYPSMCKQNNGAQTIA